MQIIPINAVKYFLYRCSFFGDIITNLKMQKLLYFTHVWSLVNSGESCFEEKFQAWPNGPVLKSVYDQLKHFGGMPIDPDFSGIDSEKKLQTLEKSLSIQKEVLDEVYEIYGSLPAFQLVALSHQENSWINARKGLDVSEHSTGFMLDKDILEQYGCEKE